MENLLVTYWLIGSIVAVITAISQDALQRSGQVEATAQGITVVPSYLIIAAAWPLAVAVSVYSLINLLGNASR